MIAVTHISSLIVLARPQNLAGLVPRIERLGGEIAVRDPAGKLVVVLETASERSVTDAADTIAALPGVLSVNLVFHGVDDPEGEKNTGEPHDFEPTETRHD